MQRGKSQGTKVISLIEFVLNLDYCVYNTIIFRAAEATLFVMFSSRDTCVEVFFFVVHK